LNTNKKLRFLSALATRVSGLAFTASSLSVGMLPSFADAQLVAPPAMPAVVANPEPPVPAPAATPTASALPPIVPGSVPANPLRDQAVNLTTQAKLALTRGDIRGAKTFIDKANALRIPDSAFSKGQLRPWEVAMEIDRAERLRTSGIVGPGGSLPLQPIPMNHSAGTAIPGSGAAPLNPGAVVTAGATAPAVNTNSQGSSPNPISTAVYQASQDVTQITPAAAQESAKTLQAGNEGETLFRDGLAALTNSDRERAVKLFTEAWKYERDLDPLVRAQLKDKLTLLQGNTKSPAKQNAGEPVSAIQELTQEQNLARQKMFREVTTEIAESEKMVQDDPNAALDRLQMLRQRVSQSSVEGAVRKTHLAMVDRVIANIQAYIEQNKPAIDQQDRNKMIEDRMALEAATKVKIDSETQSMVDQYNDLMSKEMYAESEIIAKKIQQLNPNTEIASIMLEKATIARRYQEQVAIRDMKSEMNTKALSDVDAASIPMDGEKNVLYPDQRIWTNKISKRLGSEDSYRMTPPEKAIREQLSQQVELSFDGRPLSQAMETLSDITGVPIHLDPRGLSEEGITSDQKVSLPLRGTSVSLKSALNLILEPLNLTYVIKNEVLNVTSINNSRKQKDTRTYSVRDLVIPIPNFVSDYNSGLAGALQSAYQATNSTLLVNSTATSATRLANQRLAESSPANLDPNSAALGQFGGMPGMGMPGAVPGMGGMGGMGGFGGNGPVMGSSSPFVNSGGGNGLGEGRSLANFNELINVIQTTVDGNWAADGGEDTIQELPSNLSLIVSAPLETHEAIADLLKQLRALQNLQVTLEVRFITLSDNFFEIMGVDFDFNVADKKLFDGDGLPRKNEGSSTIGLGSSTGSDPNPTTSLDVQFRQSSFSASTVGIGNPGTPATLGFAILSDLELFFFLQATQGDRRTNVLQAPKVTMFDGQIANIVDAAQRPFVISLQPVVGDFAVAQQPIIAVLSDGTTLNVQSVVSPDKRYVRMTLNPSFTRIENADRTFTFSGKTTSKTGSTVIGPDGKPTTNRDDQETTTEGSTVQLPTLGVTSIGTTVNVPDGGTILLGGIKRLQETRTEEGVPILSKIPYINRLFKNVGIGRTTNTLMMTVTPRIIIQEEEEAAAIGSALP
jgi:general secretion pathway protein D